jgi:hypothetical protein
MTKDKVDEMVLAPLYLATLHDKHGARACKGMDRGTLDRLYAKGYIGDRWGKTLSVILTDKDERHSREFFFRIFSVKNQCT